jgi:hypothetical protein
MKRVGLPGVERYVRGFEGYGLQFEIDAASRAILDQRSVEVLMPPDHSIAVLKIIDGILGRDPTG